MRFTSRWERIAGGAVLLLWPVLLPHPANAVAGCIWYPVLGLAGLIYFLGKIPGDTAGRQGRTPADEARPADSSTNDSRQLAGITSTSGPPGPQDPDSR
jgi:hypothetical protein